MIKRFTGLAGFLVVAAGLLGVAPSAKAQVALGLPPTWKVTVTPDAAAKAAGRSAFVEYIVIDATSFSGEQICRLGMQQTALSCSPAVLPVGTYNVSCTMTSNTQGTASFTGTVSNTLMQGTLSWTTGGKTYAYTYTGAPFTPDPNAE
jgi:hypothetical protein